MALTAHTGSRVSPTRNVTSTRSERVQVSESVETSVKRIIAEEKRAAGEERERRRRRRERAVARVRVRVV